MHSLKHTVVAIGLLGLSFLFYQFSSRKPPVDEESQLVAPFAEAENTNAPPTANSTAPAASEFSTLAPRPGLGATPGAITPSSPSQKLQPPNLASAGSGRADNRSLPDASPNGFDAKPNLQPSSPAGNSFAVPALKNNVNVSHPKPAPQPRQAPLDRMTTDPVARDRGLIDALQKQPNVSVQKSDFAFAPEGVAQTAENDVAHDASLKLASGTANDRSFTQPAAGIESRDQGGTAPASSTSNSTGVDLSQYANVSFRDVWPVAHQLVEEKRFKDALRLLSRFYHQPDLTGPQRQRLLGWLDGLAGKVIFSEEHHLAGTYQTTGNETLEMIAQRWKVPKMLLYNTNQSLFGNNAAEAMSGPVPAGLPLKVIQGPFNAEVNLAGNEMTLFLGDLYATRFGVRIGLSGNPRPGTFAVEMKFAEGHNWYGPDGQAYPPNSPNNHYGPHFLGLEGYLCIHAIEDSTKAGHFGCIGLLKQDAKDVFEILVPGSKVRIR